MNGSTMSHSSLYDMSVPALFGGLRTLDGLLDKAEGMIVRGKGDEADLLESRLAPDMDSFRRQIQHASDTAKACVSRLAGQPVPKLEDYETTIAELRQRIEKTRDILRSVAPEAFADAADRVIKVNFRRRWVTFDGRSYLTEYALPNFFFHVTTAYAILRYQGFEIGKLDYLVDVARRRQAGKTHAEPAD